MTAGEKKYIIVSGWMIREGTVVQSRGELILFRFPSGGGIRIRAERVYDSESEAQKAVRSGQESQCPRPRRESLSHFNGNAWHAL